MLFVAIFTFLLVTNEDPGHGIQAGSMVPWLKTADRWTIHRACTWFCLEIIWHIFGGRRVMVYIFTQVCEFVNNSSESVRCHSARVWNELPSPQRNAGFEGMCDWKHVRLLPGSYTARDTLREWQDKNHPWLELTDIHRETTENIRVTVMPFYIGSRVSTVRLCCTFIIFGLIIYVSSNFSLLFWQICWPWALGF